MYIFSSFAWDSCRRGSTGYLLSADHQYLFGCLFKGNKENYWNTNSCLYPKNYFHYTRHIHHTQMPFPRERGEKKLWGQLRLHQTCKTPNFRFQLQNLLRQVIFLLKMFEEKSEAGEAQKSTSLIYCWSETYRIDDMHVNAWSTSYTRLMVEVVTTPSLFRSF